MRAIPRRQPVLSATASRAGGLARPLVAAGLAVLLAGLAACSSPPTDDPTMTERAAQLAATLTDEQLVGQVLMPDIGMSGDVAGAASAVAEYGFGGVILMGNVQNSGASGTTAQVRAITDALQDAAPALGEQHLPLLLATDQEYGWVTRIRDGIVQLPSAMAFGAAGRPDLTEAAWSGAGQELAAVGINVDLAPVADVIGHQANRVIGSRSFGGDAGVVGPQVAAAVSGLQSAGVAATVKHFPGHGNTDTDTHIALPTIPGGWGRLDSVELAPFRAAVAAGAFGVMSAHIALPLLDGGRVHPATMSPAILTGVLRDSLHFGGVVITDALNMGALVANFRAGEVAVQVLEAGGDVLLQPADPKVVIDAVEAAVRAGRLTEARVDSSVRKLLQAKMRMGLFARRMVPLDSIPARVGTAESQWLVDDIAARAIVLAKDSAAVVDSLRAGPRPLAIITFGDERSPNVGHWLSATLRARGYSVTLFRLWPNSGPASYDSAAAAIAAQPTAMFVTAARAFPWQMSKVAIPPAFADLADRTARERPTLLLSLGSPYVIAQTPSVGSFLLGWQSNPTMEQAAARALAGDAITGRLPIRVPPALPLGAGLDRPETARATR